MKIQSINNNLNFQKQLKAKCMVLGKENKPVPCNVYRLDYGKDKNYFSNLNKKSEWENSRFMGYAISGLPRKFENVSDTFVLESKKGECLGFCEQTRMRDNYVEVIETCPKYKNNGNKNREYKYIGETLLAYLAKQAQATSVNKIILTASENAKEFYKKAGFKPEMGQVMSLDCEDYNQLIKNNKEHTGSEINLVV